MLWKTVEQAILSKKVYMNVWCALRRLVLLEIQPFKALIQKSLFRKYAFQEPVNFRVDRLPYKIILFKVDYFTAFLSFL